MKSLTFVFVLFVIPLSLAITKYTECQGNGGGTLPDRMYVRDCDEAPCDIYEGDLMEAEADFIAGENSFRMVQN